MSFQRRISNINASLISVFAVLDGWCDLQGDTAHARQEGLRTFLLETTCVLESVRLKIPALAAAPSAAIETHSKPCNNAAICINAKGHLRSELRQQLYEGLCLLDTLAEIGERVDTRDINDSLWILEEILEKGNSFINLWQQRSYANSHCVACDS